MKFLGLAQCSSAKGFTHPQTSSSRETVFEIIPKTSVYAAAPLRRGKVLSADFAEFRRLWGRNMTFKHGDAEGLRAGNNPLRARLSSPKNSKAIPRFVMVRTLWLPNLRKSAKSADKNSLLQLSVEQHVVLAGILLQPSARSADPVLGLLRPPANARDREAGSSHDCRSKSAHLDSTEVRMSEPAFSRNVRSLALNRNRTVCRLNKAARRL